MFLDNVKTAKNSWILGLLCPYCRAVSSRGKYREDHGIQVFFAFLFFGLSIEESPGPNRAFSPMVEREYRVESSFGFLIVIDSTSLKLYCISVNMSKFSFALLLNHKFSCFLGYQ